VWEAAQALLDANAKKRGKGRGRPTLGSHLFTGGLLRCGECGEAMVPRTHRDHSGPLAENYRCNGRISFVPDFCSSPDASVSRADIDAAAYRYFEQVGLDVEATRKAISDAADLKQAETRGCARMPRGRRGGPRIG
jgi:hypothetical protein